MKEFLAAISIFLLPLAGIALAEFLSNIITMSMIVKFIAVAGVISSIILVKGELKNV